MGQLLRVRLPPSVPLYGERSLTVEPWIVDPVVGSSNLLAHPMYLTLYALVAQLNRAAAYEAAGCRFNSYQAHQNSLKTVTASKYEAAIFYYFRKEV